MTLERPAQHSPGGGAASASEKYVTVSVDDGHPTDLRTLELLQEHNLKATFYIPCANSERAVMTPSQIREIDKYCEIGGHTLNHLRLTKLGVEEGRREISRSAIPAENLTSALPARLRRRVFWQPAPACSF
jgi:peptidoglycan/xylan/chitin deacetylase (PgdA/CDA1 family)